MNLSSTQIEIGSIQGDHARKRLANRPQFERVIGRSQAMQQMFSTLGLVAPLNSTVLLQGETGTGKELAARSIHEQSPRAAQRFVAFNAAAIPEALAEAGAGAAREAALGWLALARLRPRTAARHFSRARALDPESRDALFGLLASQRAALLRGERVDGLDAAALAGTKRALRGATVAEIRARLDRDFPSTDA